VAEQITPKQTVGVGHRVTVRPDLDRRVRAECSCGQSAIYLNNDIATVAAEQHVTQRVPLRDA